MQNDEKQPAVASPIEPVVMLQAWIAIDSAEDVGCDTEVLLWDGCGWHLDCVEYDSDTGTHFFSNGTKATHYQLLKSLALV